MKKIVINNQPVIFKNKDFQTIMIRVKFPYKRDDSKLALKAVLPSMLHNGCKKYPTEKEFFQEQQKLYINGCYCGVSLLIDYGTFTFTFVIPDVDSLGFDILEKQFEFFREVMYNPKVKNNRFGHKELEREINSLKVEIKRAEQDSHHYASIKAKEAFDESGIYSTSLYNHAEQIDMLNEKDLYDYYLDVIYNNHPFVYVFGNVNEKRIKELCNKYLYRTKFEKQEYSIPTNHYFPVRSKVKYVEEESTFNDSVYYSFYTIKDMKEDDCILLGAINGLLSSQSSRLLSKTLRDKHDLVYSCSVANSNPYGILIISANIQDKNIKIVRKKIKEVLLSLKNEKEVAEYLVLLKERFRISLIRQLDDKVDLFKNAIIDDMDIDFTDNYYYEKLLKVTAHDISLFVDRICLDTEYFLKEGNHE